MTFVLPIVANLPYDICSSNHRHPTLWHLFFQSSPTYPVTFVLPIVATLPYDISSSNHRQPTLWHLFLQSSPPYPMTFVLPIIATLPCDICSSNHRQPTLWHLFLQCRHPTLWHLFFQSSPPYPVTFVLPIIATLPCDISSSNHRQPTLWHQFFQSSPPYPMTSVLPIVATLPCDICSSNHRHPTLWHLFFQSSPTYPVTSVLPIIATLPCDICSSNRRHPTLWHLFFQSSPTYPVTSVLPIIANLPCDICSSNLRHPTLWHLFLQSSPPYPMTSVLPIVANLPCDICSNHRHPTLWHLFFQSSPPYPVTSVLTIVANLPFDISSKSLKQLKKHLNLKNLASWLKSNKISLNAGKTELLIFRNPRKPIDYDLKIKLDGKRLYPSKYVKYLGVLIDPHLNWSYHIQAIAPKLSRAIGMLAKIRHFVSVENLRNICHGIFASLLNYGAQIWGQCQHSHVKRIIKLQDRAIRIINFSQYREPTSALYKKSEVLKFKDIITLNNYLYDNFKGLLPTALLNKFAYLHDSHDHNTHNASLHCVKLPVSRTLVYGIHSISGQAARAWNYLHIKCAQNNLHTRSRSVCKKLLINVLLTRINTQQLLLPVFPMSS